MTNALMSMNSLLAFAGAGAQLLILIPFNPETEMKNPSHAVLRHFLFYSLTSKTNLGITLQY